MIRVLEVIPTLVRGGAEKQLALLATHLPRDRFDVQVCVLTHSGPYEQVLRDAGIPLHFLDKTWKVDPAAYYRLRRYMRTLQPDIVHTWLFAANCYGRQAAYRSGVKHILAGERCVDRWKVWHELALDRHLARRTDRIVTNSSGVRDFYAGHGIAAEKFVIIPNGIDPLPKSSLARDTLLDELGLPSDARLIGAVGRLWPQKRYKDLIWAADLLKVIRPDTHLLIIGEGPSRWRLERYREQIGIADRVHFLGQREDVPQLLPHLDCLWLGSAYEGQSNAIMEAMAAGLPVIATDIAGNRDLVIPRDTGYLVGVGDRAAFARWTNVLLEDPEQARRMGEAGRRRICDHFTVKQMVDRHASLYAELVNGT